MRQRYDDFADWYDAYATRGVGLPFARAADRLLARLLGPGHGRLCLDLGCGGGAHAPALTGLDWQPIGVDISAPQIDLARRKGLTAVVASAERLPLRDRSVDAATMIMTSTDFDDLPPVFAEAHRVLRPGGHLVVVGAHPCFGGVFVNHCNVDRIWESWLTSHGRIYEPGNDEPAAPAGHRIDDAMIALLDASLTPRQVLDPGTWYSYDVLP